MKNVGSSHHREVWWRVQFEVELKRLVVDLNQIHMQREVGADCNGIRAGF